MPIVPNWIWKHSETGNYLKSFGPDTKIKVTYNTNCWCSEYPAEFPPTNWIVANHVLDTIIESVTTECPRNGNTFKEDHEEQTETTHSVWIENLEHVHSALLEEIVWFYSDFSYQNSYHIQSFESFWEAWVNMSKILTLLN